MSDTYREHTGRQACLYTGTNYNTIAPKTVLFLFTAIEFSLDGSSPYTSADKTNNLHKGNNVKTQYK